MSDTTDISFVRDPSRGDSRLGEATGSVTYRSAGACLIIGELDAALEARASLPSLSCTVFVPDDAMARPDRRLLDTGVAVIRGGALALGGHLGDFTAVAGDGEARLDLGIACHMPPHRRTDTSGQAGFFAKILAVHLGVSFA